MCTNYIPSPKSELRARLNWPEPTFDYPKEVYVAYRAPIQILAPDRGVPELREAMFGLVPMAGFYEPDYETGKPIRWRIERQDQNIFTVAAIWDYWRSPDGSGLTSFSLLTINSDGHPVMGRFHAPGDEKRSLVIIPPECREEWLNATPLEVHALLQPMPPEEFKAYPDPRPSAKRG